MGNISVIITSYNQKDYLKEAVESVLSQTLRPMEIIICDDASSDGSQELIRSYENRYPGLVRAVLHPKNLGISKNRNSGLRAVRGELVTWLDGDDRFRPEKLALELESYLSDPAVKWVYSQVVMIDSMGRRLGRRYRRPCEGLIFERVISMLGRAPRNPLVEYASLRKVGFFDEDMYMYEDFDLCLRLAKSFRCSYRQEPLIEYRVHSEGAHRLSVEEHLLNLERLYKNFLSLISDYDDEKRAELEKRLKETIDNITNAGCVKRALSIFRTVLKNLFISKDRALPN